MARSISPVERLQIALCALVDYRTVARAYAGGKRMKPIVHERIRRAALDLGLPAPKPLKKTARAV